MEKNIFDKKKWRRKGTNTIVVQLENMGYDVYKCLILEGTNKGQIQEFHMCEFEQEN